MRAELIVCGLGPAGRALAHRALARGRRVTVIDPHPDRAWTATYGAWADDLPAWLDPRVVATSTKPVAYARQRWTIDRDYQMFDTEALRASLSLTGARVVADRVIGLDADTVRTAGGQTFTGQVVDARGLPRSPRHAEQTAYGVVLPRGDHETVFMDWRDDNGALDEPPSFLYAVPLTRDTMLFEETCLAGLPALDPSVLRARLEHRLRGRGIDADSASTVERVRFRVDGGRRGAFGAAGGFTHPATGYSVATSLALADPFLDGVNLWSPRARAVTALRRAGLRTLLRLRPDQVPAFFDLFFALPPDTQRAYLSGYDDLAGTVAAMRALFAAAPLSLRTTMATASARISRGHR
ncbi:lycopene cyclase family protein [Nocardia camponoti]|uniref:Carotenoid cyclase n=1 Tax=Nocardia camponoti TaxID=1616106 RepID=A0A917QAB1_9NOCA|nr:lycopene cyclase family protein [Nocardia camponoti]GGK38786.1 putative carotenoid cyclase [Nocardia camponoti]